MKKYDPLAHPKTFEKIFIILLTSAMAITACIVVPMIQEVISAVRYAPIGQLYVIFGISLLWNVPVVFYLLRRAWMAQTNQRLALRMIVAMLAPIAVSAIPHQINKWAADAEVHNLVLPVVDKSTQMRYPRGGDAFTVYRLHLEFNNSRIGKKTLNGEHIVFVTPAVFETTERGAAFPVSLQTGPLAIFMLQNEKMVNLMR